ncbi:MAG TPA: CDP-diacylglycerol--glycerol-3-phosphate 3-phosphatidyltransferase [Limnochordia bacterium]|jgi:CDP-diacylglycerol--glycerol-3-phosphate 3-phosphatidyltransferase|nr:CDP-diacylglycerol--glycerol-3-phosphate 3-phosphatidyltransferase [Bacillota bacterium]HOK30675.1 CDP-diacylglycerol--glycerol-3-phosphate 3-phosphatidyltransferase [Limnochordia bacterium]HOL99548.1 CDP-diacylglycerol--glycerol-3-phosphate 3-phosphatidyltransferase [Limnochordia bacterium]HOQ74607.1 CDP-diacylglycerol--glycerol-3-phosphate 3-phosphatidyltransferase [Limnochordia bacterium]HPP71462.1 CDP-diacylglycerol--glycerol-3-phosphate 3-phosphatidyltransferase [Limnochordia bacterium]
MNLPNFVTLLRISLVPLFGYLYLLNPGELNLPAALVFLLAAATDALDGYLARSRREITRFGQLIDPIADKLLITAALLALVEAGLVSTWVALIILGREFAVSGLRILAAAEGKVIPASLWGKIKTVSQIVAVMAFFLGISWAPVLMWVAVVATVLSGVRYFQKAQDVLRSSLE